MAPIPGPYGKTTSLAQHRGDSYGAHAVLDDTLNADRKNKIQSVAGTDVTD
jgi:hypothetical protein